MSDQKQDNYMQGVVMIILSAFCFACMNVMVRLAGDIPSIQKSFFRNLVAAGFAGVILVEGACAFTGGEKSQIIFATVLGYLIFGEVPDRYSIVGYILIVAASLVMFLYNRRAEKPSGV